MNYKCFIDDKQIYVHEVSDDEEDKIDFLLAAESAFEELDKKNGKKFPEGHTMTIKVVSDLNNTRMCEVVKEMKPRYNAKNIGFQDPDEDF